MVLPTSSEADRFDFESATIRSKLFNGALDDTDIDRLWNRLDRGIDLGASAIIRDFEASGRRAIGRALPHGVRNAIAGSHPNLLHHDSVSSYHTAASRDSLHWVEAGSVAIPIFTRRTESPILIVTFHGVLRRSKYVLPRFEWVNSLRSLGHNVLSFGDPTMDLDLGLEGGWWLGTHSLDLIPQLAVLVSRTMEELGAKRLVIAGSSMGGFGALQLGAYFPEATVVAFNPQTDVRRYHARRVTRVAMGSVFGADADPVPARVSVLERYDTTAIVPARIRYVTNIGDQHHLDEHYEPFASGLEDRQVKSLVRTTRDDGPRHEKIPAEAFISTLTEEIARFGRS
ncbi:hypothetical protein ET475_11845 [Microbacterium protaetiae]|uniref:Alpha/beta hydrolase n=1 Tax=Microbacterium protaetiae TaxID=2509458 RepID=A0A4P6EE92_9MICO|nr:alpha/beta hydrolase [Microbacterium protaetiae]QAY60612.1 hypothetical protein ET475_11845 [Microbacterium protaetiae]